MNKIRKNKKAISQFVSTAMVIALAIVIGFLILNWGEASFISKREDTAFVVKASELCRLSLDFEIKNIAHNLDLQTAEFLFENKGEIEVTGLVVKVFDNKGSGKTIVLSDPIDAFTSKILYLNNINFEISEIKIILEILVKGYNKKTLCEDSIKIINSASIINK